MAHIDAVPKEDEGMSDAVFIAKEILELADFYGIELPVTRSDGTKYKEKMIPVSQLRGFVDVILG